MAAKILVGIGIIILLLAGGLVAIQLIAVQLAAATYQGSVQQYARESAAVGQAIAAALASLGGAVVVAGLIVGAAGRIARRRPVARAE